MVVVSRGCHVHRATLTFQFLRRQAAKRSGTVFFKAPLYRPNLHYSVLPKPANAKAAIDAIAEWILQHHQ